MLGHCNTRQRASQYFANKSSVSFCVHVQMIGTCRMCQQGHDFDNSESVNPVCCWIISRELSFLVD